MGSRGFIAVSILILALALRPGIQAQEAVPGAGPVVGSNNPRLGWDELYASRLETSATFREAAIGVKSATLALEQYTKPYLPTVSLNTSATAPFKVDSSGFAGGSLVTSLGFEQVLGADISLKVPVKMASNGSLSLEDPGLSVSRKLFTEEGAARLDAEAALLNAQASLKNAKDTVRINLARELVNAKYYESLLEASRKNLEVLERVKKATADATALRELERRILGAKKSLLSATKALEDISVEVKENLESLLSDLMSLQDEWVKGIELNAPETSLGIEALALSFEAAEKRQDFALLPYLPNPNLTAELFYDTSARSLDWAVSFSLSYDIADKGRKSLEALKRKEYPDIYRAKLAEAKKSFSEGVRTIQSNIESLELDLKIQQLDIEDAQDELATLQALYQGGFVSEESLVISQIDLSVERLEAERIENDILMQKLNLAKYFKTEE
ncbi:MAG: TolC family protein [Spirochaetia bacterium]|jgi:outer membrane protein TolC|nr:TolC family protein [Spirochaetia bacterium]